MVRSYHIGEKRWTTRGNLRHEHKETCFKAVELNNAIFVVMCKFSIVFFCLFGIEMEESLKFLFGI